VEILSAWRPILDKLLDNDKPAFTVESADPYSAVFSTDEGFKYQFDSESIAIVFNHRIRAKPTSGGPPVMELLSQAAPYTDLLSETIKRLTEAISLIDIKGRHLQRVGIVSYTTVDRSDAPPGITKLIEQIASPLGGSLETMQAMIGTRIAESSIWYLPRLPETLATDSTGLIATCTNSILPPAAIG
jgi:hypothetical protein